MAYHYLWLEATHVGPLDSQLAAERPGALVGGTDHPWNSDSQFRNGPAGHRGARAGGHHHRADSAIHRVSDHVSHAGSVRMGLEGRPVETGVDFHAGLPDRRVPQRPAWLPGADGPRYHIAPRSVGYPISVLAPTNSAELAEALRDAAAAGRTISLAANSTKRCMAGPLEPADVALTPMSLRGVLQY